MISAKYAIVGGGLAGLSLAFRLKQAGIPGSAVCLIDPEKRIENDRTWCFFDQVATPFDHLIRKTWNQIAVNEGQRIRIQKTQKSTYKMLFAKDFFEFVWDELESWEGFQFFTTKVNSVQARQEEQLLLADDLVLRADYVFDSRPGPIKVKPSHPVLYQHFKGLFVKTAQPVFDDRTATLMDFQAVGEHACAFFYVLPYEQDEALVEYTIFSKSHFNSINLDELILPYLHERFGILNFEPLRNEVGTIPMTSGLIHANTDRHLRIGLAGNAAKPSSGYAFSNVQRQTSAIVQSIMETGIPTLPDAPARFRWYDKLMLTVLSEKYASGNDLMWQLLSRNRPDEVFRFLSEDSQLYQEAKLFARLPWGPFLKAMVLDWMGTKPMRPALNTPQIDQHA